MQVAHYSKKRAGYALLVCLMVAAVTSVVVLAILQTASFETLELSAKRKSSAALWLARGANERALALLFDQPDLQGKLPAVELPSGSGNFVETEITRDGSRIQILSTASVDNLQQTAQIEFTSIQLQQRIAELLP